MGDPDVVNVTHLIRLVRERPVLWDRTMTELYKNRRMTQLAWLEICETLVPEFPLLSEQERKAAERSMMGKWANLRDNWLRYWRKRQDLLHSGAPLDSLRKYIHHDRMIFLSKVYDTEAWDEVEQIEVEVDLPSPESMSPLADEPPESCPPVPWDLSGTVNPQEYMEWKKLAPNLIYRSTTVGELSDLAPVTVTNTNTNINQVRSNRDACNNFVTNNFPIRVPLISPCREEIRGNQVCTPSIPTIINSDFMEMKTIVGKLQQLSDKLEKTASEDSHDSFGRHVASLLRDLPASKVDSMKRKILKSLHHAKASLEEENLDNSQSVCSTSPESEAPLTVCLRLSVNKETSLNQPEQSTLPASEAQPSSDKRHPEMPETQPVKSKRKKRKNRRQNDTEMLLPSPGSRRIIKKLKPYDV